VEGGIGITLSEMREWHRVYPDATGDSMVVNAREQLSFLEAQIKGKLCQTCKRDGKRAFPTVVYRHPEYVIWCNIHRGTPELYRPETAQEYYSRTGTGDAVAQMQVERQRIKRRAS